MAAEFLLGDNYSPLSDIVKSYKDARQQSYLDQFAEKLASGDADYQSLASLAVKGRQFGLAMPLLQQAEQRKAAASVGPLISEVLGGQSSVQQAPPAAQSPPGVMPPASPAPGGAVPRGQSRIYEDPNERNPLDPPVGRDRDLLIRTIHAEAGNQGPEGMRAVASVIRNRAANGGFGGDTLPGVIRAPNQFEPVNTPDGRQRMASLPIGSKQYEAIGKIVDEAYAGNDPTSGAVNFFSPKAQAALGREVPSFAKGPGQDIGDHRFFGGAPQQTAQAGDVTTPPNSAPAQGFAVPGQQQSSGQFPPGAIKILTALQNPNLPEGARKSLELVLQRILPENKFTPIGEDMLGNKRFGFVDPNKQSVTGIDGKPVSSQGGSTAGNMPVGPDGNPLQGPELLEHLKKTDPVAAAGVRGIMEGDINAAGRNLQKLLPLAKLVDPSLQQFDYASRAKTRTDFTSGPSSREIKAINTAIYHAGELSKVSDELGGVNVAPGVINPLIQGYRRNTGDVAYQTARKGWDSTSETLATEIAKALNGGQPHVADKEAWRKVFAAANSPAEREAAVSSAMKLLEGRTHALSATYERGLGRTRDAMTFIDEPNKKAFEQLMATGKVSAPSKTQPAPTGKTNKTSTGVTWSVE